MDSTSKPFVHPNERGSMRHPFHTLNPLLARETRNVRLIALLFVAIVAGLLFSNGVPAGSALSAVSSLLPLGLRGTAIVSFGLTLAVVVLLTLVSQGGFRTGELT